MAAERGHGIPCRQALQGFGILMVILIGVQSDLVSCHDKQIYVSFTSDASWWVPTIPLLTIKMMGYCWNCTVLLLVNGNTCIVGYSIMKSRPNYNGWIISTYDNLHGVPSHMRYWLNPHPWMMCSFNEDVCRKTWNLTKWDQGRLSGLQQAVLNQNLCASILAWPDKITLQDS